MATSFPQGFLEHLKPLKKLDLDAFAKAHDEIPPTSIRLHPIKGKNWHQDTVTVKWCKQGRYLSERPDFTLDPLFHAGAYYVQEAASMCLDSILQEFVISENQPIVLDLCAAPGGKSTLISSHLGEHGVIVSNEVIKTRTSILKENLERWGYPNTLVSSNDPRQFNRLPELFDVIVVDAPCSGSGMFRKDPNAMSHWSLEAVEMCAARQKRILSDVWPVLKPGGILIYSTCSYSIQENEEIIDWLCQNEDASYLPVKAFQENPEIISEGLGYRFYPHTTQSEGLYVAVIMKMGEPSADEIKPLKQHSLTENVNPFIRNSSSYFRYKNHLGENLLTLELLHIIQVLEKHLHSVKSGILLGETKGKTFIPAHPLALSTVINPEVPHIELTLTEALQYLKKVAIPNKGTYSGWHLISYQGLPLGWGNALPNRINNGLPKSWRIRKDIDYIGS